MPSGEKVKVYGKPGTVKVHGKGGFDLIEFENGEEGWRNRNGPEYQVAGQKQKTKQMPELPR